MDKELCLILIVGKPNGLECLTSASAAPQPRPLEHRLAAAWAAEPGVRATMMILAAQLLGVMFFGRLASAAETHFEVVRVTGTLSMRLDFEKTGYPVELQVSWSSPKNVKEDGRLSLKKVRQFGVDTADQFDLGFRPSLESRYFELPGRSVLFIRQHGVGSPGGDTIHAFSSIAGTVHRVSLIDERTARPLIFTEHYSAGSPAALRILEDGKRLRTLVSPDSFEGNPIRQIDDYSWDGSAYRRTKTMQCREPDCPEFAEAP